MQETLISVVLFFLFSALITLALGGNLLVCVAVYWDRSLRRQRENLFLVSLAVSDLLVSVLVMIFAAANDLLGVWPFGAVYCQLWVCFDITCCSASILNLCAIALDRYWHIRFVIIWGFLSRPMTYVRIASRRRIFYAIVVVWVIASVIGASQLAFGFAQRENEGNSLIQGISQSDKTCELTLKPLYAIGSSMLSFFVPATVMVLLYTRLYLYARRHVRSIRTQLKQATSFLIMQLASEKIREVTAATLNGDTRSSFSNSQKKLSPTAASHHLRSPIQTADAKCLLTVTTSSPTRLYAANSKFLAPDTKVASKSSLLSNGVARRLQRFARRTSALSAARRSSAGSNAIGQNNSSVNDQKARFTLGVIMGTFLVCWLPFFCINILRSIYPDAIPLILFQCVTWLGYANSTANPLIYSILNRDFRRAFKRIIMAFFRCCEKTKAFEAQFRSPSRNTIFDHQLASSKSNNNNNNNNNASSNNSSCVNSDDVDENAATFLTPPETAGSGQPPLSGVTAMCSSRSQSSDLVGTTAFSRYSRDTSFVSCRSHASREEDTSPLMTAVCEQPMTSSPSDEDNDDILTSMESPTMNCDDQVEHFC